MGAGRRDRSAGGGAGLRRPRLHGGRRQESGLQNRLRRRGARRRARHPRRAHRRRQGRPRAAPCRFPEGRRHLLEGPPRQGADPEAAKYKDYFAWSEPLAQAPSHRILAMRRGEKELCLMMRVQLPDEEAALATIRNLFVKSASLEPRRPRRGRPRTAARAPRLQKRPRPAPSRSPSPCRTPPSAFSRQRWRPRCASSRKSAPTRPRSRCSPTTLRELLLSAPLGQRAVMAIDPGLPHRLQDRAARPPGQAAAQRRDLSRPPRGGGEGETASAS